MARTSVLGSFAGEASGLRRDGIAAPLSRPPRAGRAAKPGGGVVETAPAPVAKSRARTKPPPRYRVVMHNDDYTPMEFVVMVLVRHFAMSQEKAVEVMLTVHTRGSGIAGIYPREIAETKVQQVMKAARQHEHPLRCTMERE